MCLSIIYQYACVGDGTGVFRLPHQLPALLSLISESRQLREPPSINLFDSSVYSLEPSVVTPLVGYPMTSWWNYLATIMYPACAEYYHKHRSRSFRVDELLEVQRRLSSIGIGLAISHIIDACKLSRSDVKSKSSANNILHRPLPW